HAQLPAHDPGFPRREVIISWRRLSPTRETDHTPPPARRSVGRTPTVYEPRADLYSLDMRSPAHAARAALIACAVGAGVALASGSALAVGEAITDVRVMGNNRTDESTIRSVAGVTIGDTLELDTLDVVRERLNTTGLFADVNVWW